MLIINPAGFLLYIPLKNDRKQKVIFMYFSLLIFYLSRAYRTYVITSLTSFIYRKSASDPWELHIENYHNLSHTTWKLDQTSHIGLCTLYMLGYLLHCDKDKLPEIQRSYEYQCFYYFQCDQRFDWYQAGPNEGKNHFPGDLRAVIWNTFSGIFWAYMENVNHFIRSTFEYIKFLKND